MPTLQRALPQGVNAKLRTLAATGRPSATERSRVGPVRSRNEVRRALKSAQAPLGLTAPELLMIDTLMFLTSERDWNDGRPVVYARNRTIATHVPFGERRISELVARLADRGIVTRCYSANGKRWSVRDRDERLIEARGIDLTPMIERIDELVLIGERHRAERERHDALARRITERRVHLRDALYDFVGSDIETDVAALRCDLDAVVPEDRRTTRALRRLATSALEAMEASLERLSDRLDLLMTTFETRADATESSTRDASSINHHIRHQTPQFISSVHKREKRDDPLAEHKSTGGEQPSNARAFSPALLRRALPHFFEDFAWTDPSTLRGFAFAAEATKPSIRVDDRLWQHAHETIGHAQTVHLIAAYVYEKLRTPGPNGLQEPDAVGGYFRRCVERASAGQLHLAASFYAFAQANERAGQAPIRANEPRPVDRPARSDDDDLI